MKHHHLRKPTFRLRPVLASLLIGCIAVLFGLPASGQNVTISPSSGHLIAGLTYAGEVGFENGWSSLWRHNQLPLTLHVSDTPDLTPGGVLKDPAGDISLDTKQNLYVVGSGAPVTTDLHMSISLPRGYRFTGYRIVLLNNVNGKTINQMTYDKAEKVFYETDKTFSTSVPKGYPAHITLPSENDDNEYVMERTSKSYTDMGNNLYFLLDHNTEAFYAVTIKSIELYFTAEAEFQAEGAPASKAEINSEGVNMVGAEFTTGKLDLGIIQSNTKKGKTFFSYNFENVLDLKAHNWLYQEDAVTADKKLPETAGNGNIQVLQNDGQLYYALGNGTYYIETPTETKNQNGKSIPLGYRITGAKINAHYGTKADGSTVSYDGNIGTISHTSGLIRKTTYYLQPDGTWKTSSQTKWLLTKERRLKSGNTYLYVQKDGSEYIAYGTTDISQASNFSVSNGRVMWGDYYLSWYDRNSRARFDSEYDDAASWKATQGTVTNPAYTPSNFTLNLYGTDGNVVQSTVNVSSSNKNATAEVDKLNNDAVKFTISGLKEGSKALITYDLTMEQLNPFVNTLDIVCHSKKGSGPTITQTFTSNDFQVAGGKFDFYIPAYFADENNNCWFTFENLKSKYMDATYGNGTSGNSRNFFVKSAYYNDYGDGKQYTTSGDEAASTKVSTAECGNAPFKYNNAADLEASGSAIDATTLEEYPYSEASYKEQGGTFTTNIEVRVNDPAKDCYLFTGDETRYNIAPTTAMEHRAYAFYLMQIDLQVKEYDAYCRMTKLYNTTCYDGNQEKPMYGGVFEAYEKNYAGIEGHQIANDKAFLSVGMMVDALKAAEQREGFSADQVLYLDYTNLYSVMVESRESMAEMKAKLNPNCLIFFPERTTYDEDNYVQKTQGGGFRACRNIVITDKQPFYSPYKITVPHENYAFYSRKITIDKNGKSKLSTVVLPFSIALADGVHSNGDCTVTLYQMKENDCLNADSETGHEGKNFWGMASFDKVSDANTKPNTPYMVKVDNESLDEKTSFEILQYGSDISATTDGMDSENYTFKGKTATGSIQGSTYTFTNYGSYSGKKLKKDDGWFYFGKNKFYNSKNLTGEYLYMYPFRAYYGYNKDNGGTIELAGFGASFDDLTSIEAAPSVSDNGLRLETSRGSLTLTATRTLPVSVVAASGVLVWRANMEGGRQETITLPSGLYIVNGKKVIIR